VSHEAHLERQRRFYASGSHDHLRAREADLYAEKLARELAQRSGMTTRDRVLEVGAGFGRFTFPLLQHCGQIEALDASPRALESLVHTRNARDIGRERLRTLCADATDSSLGPQEGAFDRVAGFFILHHLPDVPAAIANLAGALRPGGRMVFLEPNRRNPLFLAQIAACPDMTWREEKGMFRLHAGKIEAAYRAAGLIDCRVEQLGFFPPQVFNRSPAARRLEARIERSRFAGPLLPFLLVQAERP